MALVFSGVANPVVVACCISQRLFMFRLPEAMAFSGVTDQDRFDADFTQRDVELSGFGDGDIVVVFAVDEKHGSLHFVEVRNACGESMTVIDLEELFKALRVVIPSNDEEAVVVLERVTTS